MKTRLYNKVMMLAVGALSLTACGDFLDKLPDERTELTNLTQARQLLITSYPDANYAWIAELSSDNLLDNQCPHLPSNPNKKKITTYYNYGSYDRFDEELYRFEPAKSATFSSYDSPGALLGGYASSISSVNYVLQLLDDLKAQNNGTDTEMARALRAEAQILRAWDHFCLVIMFSQMWKNETDSKQDIGIPYITEPETVSKQHYERLSVYETYMRIKDDLEAALPNISDSYIDAPKYHFNSQAAHAFAARFYLYMRQWDKVIEHADAVLGTDSASVENMMLDYTAFDDCTYLSDYSVVWQNPSQNNNLMLTVTGSLLQRRSYGTRYSLAGEKCQEAMLVRTSNLWPGYICPVQAVVGGMLFGSSTHDYGFFSSKIGEEFEYSDKLAGIGYPHIVQRTFTAAELLLERAEAKLMTGDVDGGIEDICLYWNSAYNHFSEKTQRDYQSNFKMLDRAFIDRYYVNIGDTKRINCFDDWNFTAENISPDYKVSENIVPYMNCLNELRRFENVFEGLRFFDLKRWGMPYKHTVGTDQQEYYMEGRDYKRALELPWEALSAGAEASRPVVAADRENPTFDSAALKANK